MSLLTKLREQRAVLKAELDAIIGAVEARTDLKFTPEEDARYLAIVEEMRQFDERAITLAEIEARQAAADSVAVEEQRAAAGRETVAVGSGVRNEPNPVYRRNATIADPSFFRDLAAFQTNKLEAASVGTRSMDEVRQRLAAAQETRAGDMTTVAGAGGEFAPPAWFIGDFVALARAGRVTADLCQKEDLPPGVATINLPKVSSGVTVAVQQTQNSALSDTAMTTTSVSSIISTVGGKQIISMQLLQQSGIPFDRVILQDLAKAYAVQVDTQVLYGSNSAGQVNGLVGLATNNAFTTASPAPASVTQANSLYYVLSKTAAAVQTGIYEPANAIVMHPNRWAWILGSVDANARPYVVPTPALTAYNPLGNGGDVPEAQGFAGTFGAYPVYIDPNIKTTANSATNQDEIYVLRTDQLWLWESPMQTASFDATYADNASILFRVLGYMAFIGNRYAAAVQSIRGTGLIAP